MDNFLEKHKVLKGSRKPVNRTISTEKNEKKTQNWPLF